jgi:hypothetical protein
MINGGRMYLAMLEAYVGFRTFCICTAHRIRGDDRGEGVISAAIAVLIMAALGALMWVGFKAIWGDTEKNTHDKVTEIGQ